MAEKSIVGDLINFRGLVYAPINESGVVFLFGKVADDLNMYIEEIKPGYPDCIGRRFIGKGWERIAIEFEFKSSNFRLHKHDPKECDIIICWEHDWKECPIEVIELKTEIQEMDDRPVARPEAKGPQDIDITLDVFLKNSNDNVKKWYKELYEKITEYDGNIWAKVGQKYSGWYSPVKSFVSVKPAAQSIKCECYSGKEAIEGTTISNKRFAPNWSRFFVKADVDVQKAVGILIESHKRIKNAISEGKATGLFSDGEPFKTTKDIINSESDDGNE